MSTLEEIKARAEKATPGPWQLRGGNEWISPLGIDLSSSPGLTPETAEFIAHSPETQAKLIAALEAVEVLHYADAEVEGLYPQACSEGPCEHEDDCPEVTITPCYECSTPGWDYVAWPCSTIKAITEALA